jgi:hypothetical protein
MGVVLYCLDRPGILSSDKAKSGAFSDDKGRWPEGKRRAFLNATLAQLVEQLICNQ